MKDALTPPHKNFNNNKTFYSHKVKAYQYINNRINNSTEDIAIIELSLEIDNLYAFGKAFLHDYLRKLNQIQYIRINLISQDLSKGTITKLKTIPTFSENQ